MVENKKDLKAVQRLMRHPIYYLITSIDLYDLSKIDTIIFLKSDIDHCFLKTNLTSREDSFVQIERRLASVACYS